MTVRTDVTVDFTVSPRIITVASPSTEITIQDLHDTIREIEDDVFNLKQKILISSAGKEDLGGGVLVGITTTLQDAQLSFQARHIELEQGTITTADSLGVTLTDSAATFVTNLVARGDLVFNLTDGSIASVVSVTSETVLVVNALTNGVDNQFDSADAYSIFDIIQCNVSGGNLTAVDDLQVSIDPIFTTFGTQIIRTSSSSATLQELEAIQFSSFGGGVTVDTTSLFTGTTFPVGTLEQPVNNFTDALSIASTRGFNTLFILGNATIDSGLNFDGFRFVGESQTKSTLTVASAASVIGAEFERATVTGTLDGNAKLLDCQITTLSFVHGFVENCVLTGTITLGGASTAHFLNCWSGVPGAGTPTIDMGGSGQPLAIRNYNGGINITNKTGADDVSIDLNAGQIILDSTVTAGTLILRGIGKLTDNSTGTTVVDSDDLIQGTTIRLMERILRNRTETDPVTGDYKVYSDDGLTVILSGNIFEDVTALTPYSSTSQRINRRNRLV